MLTICGICFVNECKVRPFMWSFRLCMFPHPDTTHAPQSLVQWARYFSFCVGFVIHSTILKCSGLLQNKWTLAERIMHVNVELFFLLLFMDIKNALPTDIFIIPSFSIVNDQQPFTILWSCKVKCNNFLFQAFCFFTSIYVIVYHQGRDIASTEKKDTQTVYLALVSFYLVPFQSTDTNGNV